jgi:hypothetical protein
MAYLWTEMRAHFDAARLIFVPNSSRTPSAQNPSTRVCAANVCLWQLRCSAATCLAPNQQQSTILVVRLDARWAFTWQANKCSIEVWLLFRLLTRSELRTLDGDADGFWTSVVSKTKRRSCSQEIWSCVCVAVAIDELPASRCEPRGLFCEACASLRLRSLLQSINDPQSTNNLATLSTRLCCEGRGSRVEFEKLAVSIENWLFFG